MMETQTPAAPVADDGPDLSLHDAVTQKESAGYRAAFLRFARGGSPLSWNWEAGLFTLLWLRRRRMWVWWWLYLPFSTPMLVVYHWFTASAGDHCAEAVGGNAPYAQQLILGLMVAGFLLPALLGNRLYYSCLTRRIARLRAATPDASALHEKLRSFTPRGFSGVSLLPGVLAFLAIVILMPSYANYNSRARVSELILAASRYKTMLGEFHDLQQRMPTAGELGSLIAEARVGDSPSNARSIVVEGSGQARSISVDEGGNIIVTAAFAPLAGRSVRFTPSISSAGNTQRLTWVCSSPDLPSICLPASCRN